jgi:hypothetical protein
MMKSDGPKRGVNPMQEQKPLLRGHPARWRGVLTVFRGSLIM